MFTRNTYITLILLFLGATVAAMAVTQMVQKNADVNELTALTATDQEIMLQEDPWNELQQIIASYYQDGGISYKGRMKVIDDNSEEEKVVEEMPFEYILYKDDYYYRLGEVEMVAKKDLVLLVDHAAKTAVLTPGASPAKNKTPFDLQGFRQLLEQGKATLKVSGEKSTRILTVENIQDPAIQGYRIFYSPDTYQVSKIELGMQKLTPLESGATESDDERTRVEGPDPGAVQIYTYYLEASFTEVQKLNLKVEDFRPEAKFLTYDQNRLKLTPAYSAYAFFTEDDQ